MDKKNSAVKAGRNKKLYYNFLIGILLVLAIFYTISTFALDPILDPIDGGESELPKISCNVPAEFVESTSYDIQCTVEYTNTSPAPPEELTGAGITLIPYRNSTHISCFSGSYSSGATTDSSVVITVTSNVTSASSPCAFSATAVTTIDSAVIYESSQVVF